MLLMFFRIFLCINTMLFFPDREIQIDLINILIFRHSGSSVCHDKWLYIPGIFKITRIHLGRQTAPPNTHRVLVSS